MQRSRAGQLLPTVGKGPTGVIKSILDTNRTGGGRRDEIFVDIVEKISCTFSAAGILQTSQVDGAVQVRPSQGALAGSPASATGSSSTSVNLLRCRLRLLSNAPAKKLWAVSPFSRQPPASLKAANTSVQAQHQTAIKLALPPQCSPGHDCCHRCHHSATKALMAVAGQELPDRQPGDQPGAE